MSFDENIASLVQRLPKIKDILETEESTKNALVMPFIASLGYDVFNPKEVVPEFTADVGVKKGEKVDYAIIKDGEAIILIECKKAAADLSKENFSQLYRYFNTTKARMAILTNGIQYQFFSDLAEKNKMDDKPFLELDLENPKQNALAEIKKMAKDDFDLDRMLSTASELKYTNEIMKVFASQVESPEDEWVRFVFQRIMPGGRFTPVMKEQFTPLVARGFKQFINDRINDRLRNALEKEKTYQEDAEVSDQQKTESDNGIVTTEIEIDGFNIVRAIAAKVVSPSRIVHRDTKSYLGVLLDDNNRKQVCRLWFNTKQKYLGIFGPNKEETKIPISDITDLYQYSDQIIESVQAYL